MLVLSVPVVLLKRYGDDETYEAWRHRAGPIFAQRSLDWSIFHIVLRECGGADPDHVGVEHMCELDGQVRYRRIRGLYESVGFLHGW